ncbi:hypothetical protein HMPREF1870_02096 [Bacteroidales bacterium KA00344]|nr:hypothetical protein HMPREF1870_02096 [Bacteroidales bacterium KA00344]
MAIVADGFKGLRKMFSRYKFQLCQFYQVLTVKAKLTSRPKLEASQELLRLTLMLCHTDNALESLNSELKIKLNLHRGMSVERRKILSRFIKLVFPIVKTL